MPNKELILASESAFRKQLMEQVGLSFKAVPSTANEDGLKASYKGELTELSSYLAQAKAQSLVARYPEQIIIGSDQVLLFNNKILPKPKTLPQVVERLKELQNNEHQLITSIAVYYKDQLFQDTVVSRLQMRALNQKEIQNYAELDQPLGCAGGYKIECHGPLLFTRIESKDHSSIVGLPLLSLCNILRNLNYSTL